MSEEPAAAEAPAPEPPPRMVSETPIITYQARLGRQVQFGAGVLLVLSALGADSSVAWGWAPVATEAGRGWWAALLPACGFLLVASSGSRDQLRLIFLALTVGAGLLLDRGALWSPLPNLYMGGRWSEAAPHWCYLLTPAFALLVGGTLGAGEGAWSRLRIFVVAAAAVSLLAFYYWPLGDRVMQQSLGDEVERALDRSLALGLGLGVLWLSGWMLCVACSIAAMHRSFDARTYAACRWTLIVFVCGFLLSRIAYTGEATDHTIMRSLSTLLQGTMLSLRELALAAVPALGAALWLARHEQARQTGWEDAF